jgi:DNA-directed RNA polymerase specialized sigma24 family protein
VDPTRFEAPAFEAPAFEAWYAREHPRLVAALAVAAGDVALGAEAADEALARAFERWHRVGAMASPDGWTYQTGLNVLRRRWRRAALERRAARRVPPATLPRGWSVEVWDALARLPERERTAVALRYVVDLPTGEIATVMRIAPGTVGSTLHAARRNLARALGEPDAAIDAEERADAER